MRGPGEPRRRFDSAKQDSLGGTAHAFTPAARMEAEGRQISKELAASDHLQGLSRPEFITQLARLHGELNQLHPFPEGNGRTQRLFLEEVAQRAGHSGPQHRNPGADRSSQHRANQRAARHDGALHRRGSGSRSSVAMRRALEHLNEAWGRDNTSRAYIAETNVISTRHGM